MPNGPASPAYRWVIVAAVATLLAIAMGQLVNGLAVFFLPLEAGARPDRAHQHGRAHRPRGRRHRHGRGR